MFYAGDARIRRKAAEGYVYFASASTRLEFPVKIGWSNNPWAAVHESGRWTWFDLKLVAFVEIGARDPLFGTHAYSLERLAHDALSDFRVRREWFDSTKEPVMRLVSMAVDGATPQTIARDLVNRLTGWLRDSWEERLARGMRRAG